MALVVGLGVVVNTFWGTVQQSVLSYATNMSISGLLQETNEERLDGSLKSLTLNSKLNSAAQAKANDMADRDYWSHNTPEGSPPWVFIASAGYEYQTAGENLAYGFDSSSAAVAGWMASPGHKANLMNTGYVDVGFGIANAADYQGGGQQTIVVAMYGSPQSAAAPAPTKSSKPKSPAAKPTPAPAPTKVAEKPSPAPKEEPIATPVPAEEEAVAESSDVPIVASQKIARIQLVSGASATWSAFAVSAFATVAIAVFFLRHGLLLRRVLVKSEAFVHKHPFLDIALIAVATIGFLLTRTDGIIR